jgi:hypothetical protein
MAKTTPTSLTIRSYDVGFGDCYLLSFHYARSDKHVLIDFGSMRQPKGKTDNGKPIRGRYMNRIAEQIAIDCDGELDVVVATHRHQDHISGFARSKGKGPGEIIRGLKPKLVLQPWTEDPQAAKDATGPATALHVRTLTQMQNTAQYLADSTKSLRGPRFAALRAQIREIGMDNISNKDAVTNLKTMAKNRYVHYGRSAGLGRILRGVKVKVLGPPTVDQTDTILKQRGRDEDEFWHLNATYWHRLAMTQRHHGDNDALFPEYATRSVPRSAGWFRYWMKYEQAESMLSIVRSLDKAMNNTSLILLFEINGKLVLFPGDAQYENWMYALSKESVKKQLRDVDIYKVGHHGSLNATPKTLWRGFEKKGSSGNANRLRTLLSTKEGVHGHSERKTEVPRKSLLRALEDESSLTSTTAFAPEELSRSIQLEF